MMLQLDFIETLNSVTVTVEEWRTVEGFPDYEVSNMGQFRNKRLKKFCRGTRAHNGYQHIGLCRNGKQVTQLAHRLVAMTFLECPSPDHNQVDHINKDRRDNRVSNLEWVTRSENTL